MGEKTNLSSVVTISVFVLTVLGIAGSLQAAPPGWAITLLTNGGKDPQVSGSNVVWEGSGPVHGEGLEIFFWDGANTTQLTHISYNDAYPQISASNVVWVGWIPGPDPEYEIFFWDGSTTTELTTANNYDNWEPQLSGSNVVWQAWDGSDWEIFFWDGAMPPDPCQLTNNSYDDKNPQISGWNVVWHGPADGNDYEISFWDGTMPPNPVHVTNNSLADTDPQISGSNVVWMGSDGSDMEIFFWDGTMPPDPCQLTDNSFSDTSPQISGSNVVWVSWTGGGYSEVVFWNGATTVLHGYELSDCKPQISGSNVVWMLCWNGHSPVWLAFPDNDYDGVPDSEDNCPTERNPDQRDVDGDTVGDICDECPADKADNCDPCKTGAASIPPGGGTVSTADGSVNMTVPANALGEETSISITGSGEGASFELTPSPGSGTSYDKVVLNPAGQHFNAPVTITLSWPDTDNDGYIDGPNPGTNTNIKEANLQVLKDGKAITKNCDSEPSSCNMAANRFSVQVTSLSDFALFELWQPAGPLGAWGWDIHGQTRVPADRYVGFSAGVWHSIAIKTDGSLVGWGRNDSNQIDVPDGNGFVAVAAGDGHSLALRTDGSIGGWGRNDYGQATAPDGNDYVAITAGMIFSLALKADGSLVAWGGDPNLSPEVNVPAGNDFVAVSAGWNHGLALRSDGTLAAWGNDTFDQVSDKPDTNDFVAISAGCGFNLALKDDGSIVAWGDDSEGQCSVPDGNSFTAVSAGGYHGLALRGDGSMVAWGQNTFDQAGPPTGNNFLAISAGGWHNLAVYECRATLTADLTGDCYVNIRDLAIFCQQWIECGSPFDPNCLP